MLIIVLIILFVGILWAKLMALLNAINEFFILYTILFFDWLSENWIWLLISIVWIGLWIYLILNAGSRFPY